MKTHVKLPDIKDCPLCDCEAGLVENHATGGRMHSLFVVQCINDNCAIKKDNHDKLKKGNWSIENAINEWNAQVNYIIWYKSNLA